MHASLVTFGFLPVIVFLAVDSFGGKRNALLAALAAAAAQAVLSLMRTGLSDWLGLAGFAILAALVMQSFRARDDFWFKIHGPVMNAVSAAILLVGWFAFDRALVLDAAAAEIGIAKLAAMDPSLTPEAVSETLRVMSLHLPFWLLAHAALTAHAAAHWGKWAWAAARIPGFLLMMVLASAFAQASATK